MQLVASAFVSRRGWAVRSAGASRCKKPWSKPCWTTSACVASNRRAAQFEKTELSLGYFQMSPWRISCQDVGMQEPAQRLGIIGGGQLARMLAESAIAQGLAVAVLSPSE